MLVRRTLGVVLLATAYTATGNDSGPTAGAQGKAPIDEVRVTVVVTED